MFTVGLVLMQAGSDFDSEEVLDNFSFLFTDAEDNSVAVLSGVFVAPSDNTYKFMLRADDSAVLYASTAGDPSNAVSRE